MREKEELNKKEIEKQALEEKKAQDAKDAEADAKVAAELAMKEKRKAEKEA